MAVKAMPPEPALAFTAVAPVTLPIVTVRAVAFVPMLMLPAAALAPMPMVLAVSRVSAPVAFTSNAPPAVKVIAPEPDCRVVGEASVVEPTVTVFDAAPVPRLRAWMEASTPRSTFPVPLTVKSPLVSVKRMSVPPAVVMLLPELYAFCRLPPEGR